MDCFNTVSACISTFQVHQVGRQRDRVPQRLPSDPADEAGQPSLPTRDAGANNSDQLHCYYRWVGRSAAG